MNQAKWITLLLLECSGPAEIANWRFLPGFNSAGYVSGFGHDQGGSSGDFQGGYLRKN